MYLLHIYFECRHRVNCPTWIDSPWALFCLPSQTTFVPKSWVSNLSWQTLIRVKSIGKTRRSPSGNIQFQSIIHCHKYKTNSQLAIRSFFLKPHRFKPMFFRGWRIVAVNWLFKAACKWRKSQATIGNALTISSPLLFDCYQHAWKRNFDCKWNH